MQDIKQDLSQLIEHRMALELGSANMLVTEALIKHLRSIQTEALEDSIIVNQIEAANDN